MNSELVSNEKFFNFVASKYDNVCGGWTLRVQKRALGKVAIKNGYRILDSGCGTGNFLKTLEMGGKRLSLYGIDISKEMLRIASDRLVKSKLKLESAEKLRFKKNFFNIIFSTDAFHHYYDKNKAMSNFYKCLKSGGNLVIIDLDFGVVLNKLFKMIEPGNNGALNRKQMKELFLSHGFSDIKQSKVGFFTLMTWGVK
jgi:ubiquinone/menaquinone biosynthesis C-methylase UbiE